MTRAMNPIVNIRNWRALGRADRRVLGIVALITGCVSALVLMTPLARWVEDRVGLRALFDLRQALGQEPPLDERIKILVVDDPTIAFLGKGDLAIEDWTRVFSALAERRPKSIVIDKLFDLRPEPKAALEAAARQWQSLGTEIVAGAFASEREIAFRQPLATQTLAPEDVVTHPDRQSSAPRFLYGPVPELREGIRRVGALNYLGFGRIEPAVSIGPGVAIKHLGFAGAGADPARRTDGPELVNLLGLDTLWKRSIGMKAVVQRARAGGTLDLVDEGDVVVILPAMYTGNNDEVSTPRGEYPGGFVVTSVLSANLSGRRLEEPAWRLPFGAGAWLVGCLAGIGLWSGGFFAVLIAAVLGLAVTAVTAFHSGYATPWVVPSFLFLIGALPQLAVRLSAARRAHTAISGELARAQLLQNTIMPPADVSLGGIAIRSFHQASSECSGDWWTVRELGPGRLLAVIGDANGHGVAAAFVAASAAAAVDSFLRLSGEGQTLPLPSRLLAHVNEVLLRTTRGSLSMTMAVAEIDLIAETCTAASAAHLALFHVKAGGKAVRFKIRGDLLGTEEGLRFRSQSYSFKPGDRLILYSDGLVETRGSNRTPWREVAFRKFVDELGDGDADECRRKIVGQWRQMTGRSPVEDDVTLVVIEWTAGASAETPADAAMPRGNE